jgi:hypothetical protein
MMDINGLLLADLGEEMGGLRGFASHEGVYRLGGCPLLSRASIFILLS